MAAGAEAACLSAIGTQVVFLAVEPGEGLVRIPSVDEAFQYTHFDSTMDAPGSRQFDLVMAYALVLGTDAAVARSAEGLAQ